ncbi:MAG: enoyl-CoA hydratase/isomerase family protein [Gammaproteobacteria bacterium]
MSETAPMIRREGYTTIEITREGPIDRVVLNRPERLNSITTTMFRELHRYLSGLCGDESCRVVTLRGAGRGFCAGMDIKEVVSGQGDGLFDNIYADSTEPNLHDLVRLMRACPQPIIALVNGAAVGGGFGLALAADVRIAGASARMATGFTKVGTSGCEMGVSFLLPRLVGSGQALELMYTSRLIDAQRALRIGLVNDVVADEALDEAGRALATEMLGASVLGLRRTKETFNRVQRLNDLDAALELESHTQMRLAALEHMDRLKAFAERK